jgi:hypothetical protein
VQWQVLPHRCHDLLQPAGGAQHLKHLDVSLELWGDNIRNHDANRTCRIQICRPAARAKNAEDVARAPNLLIIDFDHASTFFMGAQTLVLKCPTLNPQAG